jgi:Skp family chaperone for outer membrane proteins
VLEKKTQARTIWLRLDIPTISNAWMGIEKQPPSALLADYADPKPWLSLPAEQTDRSIGVKLDVSAPPFALPLTVWLVSGDKDEQIALLNQRLTAGQAPVPVPAALSRFTSFTVLVTAPKSLSWRKRIKLPVPPAVLTVAPAILDVSPLTVGEREVQLEVSCEQAVVLSKFEAPLLLASATSFPQDCSGEYKAHIRVLLNVEEWRRSSGRVQPIPGKLYFREGTGEEQGAEWQIRVRETWSWWGWVKYVALPRAITLAIAVLFIFGCVLFAARIFRPDVLSKREPAAPGIAADHAADTAEWLKSISSGVSNILSSMSGHVSAVSAGVNKLNEHLKKLADKIPEEMDLVVKNLQNELKRKSEQLSKSESEAADLKASLERERTQCKQLEDQLRAETARREQTQQAVEQAQNQMQEEIRKANEAIRKREKHLVFVSSQAVPALEELRLSLSRFITQLGDLRSSLKETSGLSAAPRLAVAQVSDVHLASFPTAKVQEYVSWIRELEEHNESVFPDLVFAAGGGVRLEAGECQEKILDLFHTNCILEHWDLVLRGLYRLRQLDKVIELDHRDREAHCSLLESVDSQLARVHETLASLDIVPVSLPFLSPPSEKARSFVVYVREQAIRDLYPLWSGRDAHGLVLDAECWAYLDRQGHMRGKRQARVVISA